MSADLAPPQRGVRAAIKPATESADMRETLGQIMRGVPVKDGTKAKRVANNTVKYIRPDGAEVIRLHHTDIVIRHPNGQTELNSGGWRTSTTKERINSYSPARLYQAKGEWFLSGEVPFTDGMRLDAEGKVIGYKPDKAAKALKARAKLAREINKFSQLILDESKYPAVPMPNGGDCWLCAMERPATLEERVNAKLHAVGDALSHGHAQSGKGWNCNNDPDTVPGNNTDHLLSHLKEGYLHGSLIFNALAWAGYDDPFFIMHTRYRDLMRRALRRFLRRRLGLG